MAIRLTGLISNMDTDALIKSLMEAQSTKKTKVSNDKKKLEWKNDKWKDLNTKLVALYNEKVTKMKLQGSYNNRIANSSNESKATVTALNSAAKGSYTLQINKLASSQYVTGKNMSSSNFKMSTKLTELFSSTNEITGLEEFGGMEIGTTITLSMGAGFDQVSTFTVGEDSTIASFVNFLKGAGLNASFDEKQGRFFIGSASSGLDNQFLLEANALSEQAKQARDSIKSILEFDKMEDDDKKSVEYALHQIKNLDPTEEAEKLGLAKDLLNSIAAKYEKTTFQTELDAAVYELQNAPEGAQLAEGKGLDALGLGNITTDILANGLTGDGMIVTKASNSEYVLNGATLTDSSNTVTVNGLSINLQGVTNENEIINLTVGEDTQKNVDQVKEFVKSYNELLLEMSTLYYAKSAKGYDMLSEEEEADMTENQVELWNNKIKDSLLRRDDTLSNIMQRLRTALQTTVEVDGARYSLSSFGIVTGEYTERGLLHINGDKEDGLYADKEDMLTKMFSEDPELSSKVLSKIFGKLSDEMFDMMKKTKLSSSLTFYNDLQIQKQMDEYDEQIKSWTTRLTDMEDKYYKQFSAMEVSLQKLQNQQNQLAGFFG